RHTRFSRDWSSDVCSSDLVYNHFSGIIVDMFYDHFLAKNWATYSDVPLLTFANQFYGALLCHYDDLNDKTKYLIPYMTKNNWLRSEERRVGKERRAPCSQH